MKKLLLFLPLIFVFVFTINAYAQERDDVGHRVGSWSISKHNCFQGLVWKIRKSYYSDQSESYTNEIEIKNNYTSPVTFSYNFSGDASETTTRYRKTLNPNETYTSTYCPNIHMVYFYIADVCFNGNCKTACYAECDNGSPNQTNCGNSNSSNSSSNKQNDLTDYNNSKAQLERQQAQEKQERFNSYIEQGDQAMQSEDYAAAMSHYQNAQNFATTDSERSTAKQKYDQAFQKKKDVQRKKEIAEVKKTDEKENVSYAATTTATIAAMSLLEDRPSEAFTSGKIYMGLGIEQIPLISNNAGEYHTNKSYIESPLVPGFDLGIIFGIANNKIISLYLNPRLSYAISAFSAGTNGGLFEYGGTAMIRGNWNREFPLKLYAEGGYFKRSATFHYDADASSADSGVSSSTDDVRDGEYDYSVIRYGGGLMYHRIDDDEESMVKAGVFFDKPSFFPKDIKPTIGFSLQGMYNKLGSLEVYYSPNYFIGGNVLYPATLEKENKSYFGIKFTRTGNLW